MDFQNLANQIYQQSEKVCYLLDNSFHSQALHSICKAHPILISNGISFDNTGDINYSLSEPKIPFNDAGKISYSLFEKYAHIFAYAKHSGSSVLSSAFKESIFLIGKKPIICDSYPLEYIGYSDLTSFGRIDEYWAEISWALKEHKTMNPGVLSSPPKDNKFWYKYSLKQKNLLAKIYEERLFI